jgi:hypothetical protein
MANAFHVVMETAPNLDAHAPNGDFLGKIIKKT